MQHIHHVPTAWKSAKIILSSKKLTDLNLTHSYTPISLISSLGKTLEKIINTRLTTWAQDKSLAKNKLDFAKIDPPKM